MGYPAYLKGSKTSGYRLNSMHCAYTHTDKLISKNNHDSSSSSMRYPEYLKGSKA